MIILDTNVLSELLRVAPEPAVLDWLGMQTASTIYSTTVTQAEMLLGVALLPAGKRRTALARAVEAIFAIDLAGRILDFDGPAAGAYAEIAAARRRSGKPIAQIDAQIAGIARSTAGVLATRNVSDFQGCGVEVLNPWER